MCDEHDEDASDVGDYPGGSHCFTQLPRCNSVDSLFECSNDDIFSELVSPASKRNKLIFDVVCISFIVYPVCHIYRKNLQNKLI
jgi:hypothetical protein